MQLRQLFISVLLFLLFSGYILANQMYVGIYILDCMYNPMKRLRLSRFPYFQFCGAHDAVDSNPHRSMIHPNEIYRTYTK